MNSITRKIVLALAVSTASSQACTINIPAPKINFSGFARSGAPLLTLGMAALLNYNKTISGNGPFGQVLGATLTKSLVNSYISKTSTNTFGTFNSSHEPALIKLYGLYSKVVKGYDACNTLYNNHAANYMALGVATFAAKEYVLCPGSTAAVALGTSQFNKLTDDRYRMWTALAQPFIQSALSFYINQFVKNVSMHCMRDKATDEKKSTKDEFIALVTENRHSTDSYKTTEAVADLLGLCKAGWEFKGLFN